MYVYIKNFLQTRFSETLTKRIEGIYFEACSFSNTE